MADETVIDWGDGTPKENGPAEGEAKHKYDESLIGEEQTITVCRRDAPDECTEIKFTPGEDGGQTPTPEPGGELKITAKEAGGDDERMTVKVTVDNGKSGKVKLDFGDGSDPEEVEQDGEATHAYPRAGKFKIKGTDTDDPKRTDTTEVTVPFGDGETPTPTPTPEPEPKPKAEAERDETDEKGRTAKLTYEGFPQGPVMISWGDRSTETEAKGPKGEEKHAYTEAEGEQKITVTGEKDTKATATFTPKKPGDEETPTPTPEPEPKPKVEAKADDADESGRTAAVTYSGFPKGKISAAWGDEKKTEVDGPKGTASHSYGKDVKDEVTIVFTAVEDEKMKAETTFTPKAPSARRRYRS